MYAILYSFRIKKNKKDEFIQAWKELTKLIHKYCNSNGSRLHKAADDLYVAYANWPDEETWSKSGEKLPERANRFRDQMQDSCEEIKVEYTMPVVEDLIS